MTLCGGERSRCEKSSRSMKTFGVKAVFYGPSGAKAQIPLGFSGTAEAMPFYQTMTQTQYKYLADKSVRAT